MVISGCGGVRVVTRLRAAVDVRPAEWVVAGLRGFGESVLSLVPAGFPAYVRVFHPGYRQVGTQGIPVPWAEIAAANARYAHSGMQLGALTGSYESLQAPQPGLFDDPPRVGGLPPELIPTLASVLARHTTTPDRCWFAVWNGFGDLGEDVRRAPTFLAPHREYHLLRGPTESAAESVTEPPREQSPNLWWPDDRAWCVATEIDLDSTYIGCDDACREEILALSEIEALPIDPATGIDFRSDLRNPSNS
jgi:hypothetical protein